MKEVRWHGRGGQGSFTIARLLGSAAVIHEGKHALAFPSFGPERRGAPVLGFTRISDEKSETEVKSRPVIMWWFLMRHLLTKAQIVDYARVEK